jgi:hypothetical protein
MEWLREELVGESARPKIKRTTLKAVDQLECAGATRAG